MFTIGRFLFTGQGERMENSIYGKMPSTGFFQTEKHNKLMAELREKFKANGYDLPKIIYWNVDSRNDVYHATCEQHNVAMVSGQSTSTFKTVLKSIDEDAYEMMLSTLNDPIYDIVRV